MVRVQIYWAITASIGALLVFGELAARTEVFGASMSALGLILVSVLGLAGIWMELSRSVAPNPTASLNSSRLKLAPNPQLYPIISSLLATILYLWGHSLVTFKDVSDFQPVVLFSGVVIVGTYFYLRPDVSVTPQVIVMALGILLAGILLFDKFLLDGVVGGRHSSMYLLIPLILISQSRHKNTFALSAGAAVIALAVVLSSSRTATATVLVIGLLGALLISRAPISQRLIRSACILGPGVGGIVLYTPTRNRFFSEEGDRGLVVTLSESITGGESSRLTVNTNGRLEFWRELGSTLGADSIVLGQGAGYSRSLMRATFGESHPHNEYLRILVDFGLFGLSLSILVVVTFLIISFTNSRSKPGLSESHLLMVVVVGLLALTDLPMVAPGVMLPFGMISGYGLKKIMKKRVR